MKELSIVAICIDPDAPILERFLSSVRQYTRCDYELILVDNAGDNGQMSAFLEANCDRYIRLTERQSVAAAWNTGIAAAAGRFVLVTNDDVVVSRHWFEQMTAVFRDHAAVGMVAPVMNYSVPEQTHVGDISHLHEAGPVRLTPFEQFVWGAFMLFTRDALAAVGGFSEEFEIAGGEDIDICFKLFEAALDIYVHHRVFIYHEWGSTGARILGAVERQALYEENYRKFKSKWVRYTSTWSHDPEPAARKTGGRLMRWWSSWRRTT